MHRLFIASVGDGLCGGFSSHIRGSEGGYTQFDWGGATVSDAHRGYSALRARLGCRNDGWSYRTTCDGPDEFLLSHYHADHYRGLVAAARDKEKQKFSWAPDLVFAPGLPKFKSNREVYCALFTMSAMVLGSESGSMDFDFLGAVHRLRNSVSGNGKKSNFKYRQLFQGDEFSLGKQSCTALWPPRYVDDKVFSSTVEKALLKFEEAQNADDVLREIHNRITESEFVDRLLSQERSDVAFPQDRYYADLEERWVQRKGQPLLPVVEEANRALRAVANHLSLGFFTEGGLLFLGDISEKALPAVVDKLVSLGEVDFMYLIAPHHGTFWDKSLLSLRANTVIVSTGKRLAAKYNPHWGLVGKTVLSSYLNRDIQVDG